MCFIYLISADVAILTWHDAGAKVYPHLNLASPTSFFSLNTFDANERQEVQQVEIITAACFYGSVTLQP
jgi:hypothetical protein